MKKKRTVLVILLILVSLVIAWIMYNFIFWFPIKQTKNQKPLPEFTYESETVVNKIPGLSCDTYLFICSSHETHTKGFFPIKDFTAALNVKVTDGEMNVQVSSDTRIVDSSRESKQIPATRQEAWSVLSQSSVIDELDDFFSDVTTMFMGDNAVERNKYVIAFFTFPSNTIRGSNKGLFFIYEKSTKDIVYLSTIMLNEDYLFYTTSTSMTLKQFGIK